MSGYDYGVEKTSSLTDDFGKEWAMNDDKLIDLQPFCATCNDPRKALRQPFVVDGRAIATNAYVLISVPIAMAVPFEEDAGAKPPNVSETIEKAHALDVDWIDIPGGWPVPDPVTLDAVTCDMCDGTGEVECDYCGHEHDCADCDGTGLRYPYPPKLEPVAFAGERFNPRNLNRLAALPGAQLGQIKSGQDQAIQPHPVRFTGGIGIIMPANRRATDER